MDTATLLMLNQQGDSKACIFLIIIFIFCGSYAFAVHNLSAVLGLWLLSLYGVTVLSLPGGYQVNLEFFVVRQSLKFISFVCLLT